MRPLRWWIAMLLILCAPAVSLAQSAVRDAGGTERFLFGQRLILGMLAALITITLILGILTIASVFRDRRGGLGGVPMSRSSGDLEERQHPDDQAA